MSRTRSKIEKFYWGIIFLIASLAPFTIGFAALTNLGIGDLKEVGGFAIGLTLG